MSGLFDPEPLHFALALIRIPSNPKTTKGPVPVTSSAQASL
jgi:hypothetical protein